MDTYVVESWEALSQQLASRPRTQAPLLIAVDGPGGSGKTTLAQSIADHTADATVLHLDDVFFRIRCAPRPEATPVNPVATWIGGG